MEKSETKKRILVVDDEVSFCTLLKLNLEKRGCFEVVATSNPHDVIRLAKEYHPDLILLDILMPEMDGMTLAASLRSNKDTGDIPIAFLTALADEEDVRDVRGKAWENYIFSKLGSTDELIISICEMLK
ncbi:MAG: response regulator [Nitrospirae bacterium]|nr:response regulator [Nitrospirota bacterium]